MAIGSVNVSVVANTSNAIAKLRTFGHECRQAGQSAKQMAANFQGNTLADFAKRFKPPTIPPAAISSTREFRSTVVDLSKDTDRYNRDLAKQLPLLKNLEKSFKAVKSIGKIFLVAEAFRLGFDFGQKLGNSLAKGFEGALKDAKGWLEGWLDPGMVEVRARKEEAARQQRIKAQEKAQADKEREQQAEVDFQKRLAEAELDRRAAMGVAVDRQFAGDVEQFGEARAIRLANIRKEAARAEEDAAEKKRRDEERVEALKERSRKWEAQQEKRRERQRKEQESLSALMNEVNDFWLTADEKGIQKRAREIEAWLDPAQQERGFRELDKLQAFQRMKAREDAAYDDADTRRSRTRVEPLDARTKEGWAALRDNIRSGPQQQLLKTSQSQLAELRRLNSNLEQVRNNNEDVFAFN